MLSYNVLISLFNSLTDLDILLIVTFCTETLVLQAFPAYLVLIQQCNERLFPRRGVLSLSKIRV